MNQSQQTANTHISAANLSCQALTTTWKKSWSVQMAWLYQPSAVLVVCQLVKPSHF